MSVKLNLTNIWKLIFHRWENDGPEAYGLVEHADGETFPDFPARHKYVFLMMHSSGYEAAYKCYESLKTASFELSSYHGQ